MIFPKQIARVRKKKFISNLSGLENFKRETSEWKYVRVCFPTHKHNHFIAPYGKRESLRSEEALEKFKDISLIIPCWSHTPIPTKLSNQISECEWLQSYIHPRYFGLLDFDADLNDIKKGEIPVFEGINPQVYNSIDTVKIDFALKLQKFGGGKFFWALQHNTKFKDIYEITKYVSELMTASNIPHLVYFSGGCGFRILFRDKRMFFAVGWFEQYVNRFIEEIWPYYLSEVLKCPQEKQMEILNNTDKSIYDREKGVKTDLNCHYVSRLYPVLLKNFEEKEIKADFDNNINELIIDYWKWVFNNIPSEMPYLKANFSKSVISAIEKEKK